MEVTAHGWQDIATAPRGVRILVWSPEIGACVASAGWRNETPEIIQWEVVNDIVVAPTHWMPLPASPTPPPRSPAMTVDDLTVLVRLRACAECEQAPLAPLLTDAANEIERLTAALGQHSPQPAPGADDEMVDRFCGAYDAACQFDDGLLNSAAVRAALTAALQTKEIK